MLRLWCVVATGLWLVGSSSAQGQRPIQWISNVQQGVGKAKRTGLPLMFYIAPSSRVDDGDLDDAQQEAFRNPLVRGIAEERFVAVRLARSNETAKLLAEMGVGGGATGGGLVRYGGYVVCGTPNGELLGVIAPGQVASAKALAGRMTTVFREYRVKIFDEEVKPKLKREGARPADIINALKLVDRFVITEADGELVALLEEAQLSKTVKKRLYDVLAVLSTPRGVKALLEIAPRDKLAAAALARCTPAGADVIWSTALQGDKEQFIAAYTAVTKICKMKGVKPRGFWGGPRQQLIDAEIERVTKEVEKTAKRWRETYGQYR